MRSEAFRVSVESTTMVVALLFQLIVSGSKHPQMSWDLLRTWRSFHARCRQNTHFHYFRIVYVVSFSGGDKNGDGYFHKLFILRE